MAATKEVGKEEEMEVGKEEEMEVGDEREVEKDEEEEEGKEVGKKEKKVEEEREVEKEMGEEQEVEKEEEEEQEKEVGKKEEKEEEEEEEKEVGKKEEKEEEKKVEEEREVEKEVGEEQEVEKEEEEEEGKEVGEKEEKEEEKKVEKEREVEKEVGEEQEVEKEEEEEVEEEREVEQKEENEVEKKEEKEVEKEEEMEEKDVDSKLDQHSHQFREELPTEDEKRYNIFCGLSELVMTIRSKRKEKQTKAEEKKTSGIGVRGAVGEIGSTDRSNGLIKRMLSAFDGTSYQKQLELKRKGFGKIQQSFSEVHRIRKLLKLGESVCKVIVKDVSEGTGFVLFDRYILTNAHLFETCVKGNTLDTDVCAMFNYDEPLPDTKSDTFTANKTLIDFDLELDYAILELNPKARKDTQRNKSKNKKVPAGLLSVFGPPPKDGGACLIGHPAGGVKQMDPTCIIEIEKRGQVVEDHLYPYKHTLFILQSIIAVIKQRDIDSIMVGGSKTGKVVTYNTFMYHGASGSPVFDARCRVFGLHTGGYCYGFPKDTESVIEYAVPLLPIFESFVSKLKGSGNKKLWERVQEAAKGNSHLERIIKGLDAEEPMDTD